MTVRSLRGTAALARALADRLPAESTLALHGDLGSGKTTFVRALARAWGVTGTVASPTFSLMQVHAGRRTLVHVDAYRLSGPEDFDALLLEDWLRPPWCLAVEWPGHVRPALPGPVLDLWFRLAGPTAREIRLGSPPDR